MWSRRIPRRPELFRDRPGVLRASATTSGAGAGPWVQPLRQPAWRSPGRARRSVGPAGGAQRQAGVRSAAAAASRRRPGDSRPAQVGSTAARPLLPTCAARSGASQPAACSLSEFLTRSFRLCSCAARGGGHVPCRVTGRGRQGASVLSVLRLLPGDPPGSLRRRLGFPGPAPARARPAN